MNPYPNLIPVAQKYGCKAKTLHGIVRNIKKRHAYGCGQYGIDWDSMRSTPTEPRVDCTYYNGSQFGVTLDVAKAKAAFKAWHRQRRVKELEERCDECDLELRRIIERWVRLQIDMSSLVRSMRATLEYGCGGKEEKKWLHKSCRFPSVWKNAGWRIEGDLNKDIDIIVENYRGTEKHRFHLTWQQVKQLIRLHHARKQFVALGVTPPDLKLELVNA